MPRTQRLRALGLLCALAFASACATTGDPDPWRNTNEKVFRFNERVDKGLLEPVAKGYDQVSPGFFQTMIGNFFQNLSVPRTFVNNLLQGEPLQATQDFGRLLVNTTFGVAGFFDVASKAGMREDEEDFGQTLGVWGVGPGPYVMVPLAGPFTVRDAAASPLDIASNPTTWLNVFGISVVRVVNTRAQFLEEVAQARKDAVDYYVFVRDAYLTSRERDVRDGAAAEAVSDDLYDIDDLEDDEASEGAETDASDATDDAQQP